MPASREHPEEDYDALRYGDVRALLPLRRKSRNDKLARGKGVLPYPVYVAKFEGGRVQRLSFWSAAGKPIDFAAGYNVSLVIGREKPVAGAVIAGGTVYADPFFGSAPAPAVTKRDSPAKRLAAIVRALNEGEIEAAILLAKAETCV